MTDTMKIGVLVSSYDETNSPFAEFDEYQNPGIYVKTHEFHLRVVTKKNAKEQIDRIVEEGFDYIWNFLWGLPDDNIAGIDEVKYLESKNVPMLGASSKYLLLTKLDQKNAIASAGLKTPKGIAIKGDEVSLPQLDLGDLQFPLISKPAVGCGSEFLTEQSVCSNLTKLWTQIEILKSKVNCEILIEEFIDGQEVACIVLETRNGNIALEPLIYEFPDNYPSTKRFLDFQKKFAGVETGEVKYKIFDGDASLKKNIQETAIKAYESLGVLGSGYARVDIRIRGSDLYVLEINHTPAFFAKIGNTYGDDFTIESTFPGGHERLGNQSKTQTMKIGVLINPTPAFFAKIGNTYGDDFTIESTFPGGHERLVEEIITSKRRFDVILQAYKEIANVYEDQILIKNDI
ncbi:D-alanine--D-alanine ligase [Pseudolycoriella hygida]|uniref:D-alanine--D-alanine ligase n=1 Tax=Pseudolycoriella hygida TaxID=35572 RepID=A0A9Q0RWN5_9DIPT|nr:D-alanine--D-alanine ligase [Pseudolycoriella hygida]